MMCVEKFKMAEFRIDLVVSGGNAKTFVKSLLKVNQWNIEQSSCGISSFL
jgi:hypothetical protein